MDSINDLQVATTYNATIYCGFRPGYEKISDPDFRSKMDRKMIRAEAVCRSYCDDVGLCVTVEPTTYIYKEGFEPGVKVGLINYPRFEPGKDKIQEHALQLAKMLKEMFKQKRVSIVFTDVTVMLGENED